jgi:hypothetical protein
MHRIALKIVAVIACPHLGLLASKLTGKASTNLGASQSMLWSKLSMTGGLSAEMA